MRAKKDSRELKVDQERSDGEGQDVLCLMAYQVRGFWLLCVQNFKAKRNSPLSPCFIISAPNLPAP